MLSLVEQRHVPASPQLVWQFFEDMEAHYAEWHREHLRWRWLSGNPLQPGSAWFADEWLGPVHISSRFFVVESAAGRGFSYRIGFPHALAKAGGSFAFTPAPDGGCDYHQEVHFGYSIPLVGTLIDHVLASFLPLKEFRRHMREEQANLVELLCADSLTRASGRCV